MECQRCGQCCLFVTLVLKGHTPETDPQELNKWIKAHYCKTAWIPADGDNPGSLAVRVPLVCQYLDFDNTNNIAHCIVFDSSKRPKLCSEYYCDKVTNEGTPAD